MVDGFWSHTSEQPPEMKNRKGCEIFEETQTPVGWWVGYNINLTVVIFAWRRNATDFHTI